MGFGVLVSLVDLLAIRWAGGEKKSYWWFKQVVWQLASRCEAELERSRSSSPIGGAPHIENTTDEAADDAEEEPGVPEAKRRRLLAPALGEFAKSAAAAMSRAVRVRYFFSMRRHFGSETFISVCIDCSRLARLGLLVGAIAKPNNVAAWMPPQA